MLVLINLISKLDFRPPDERKIASSEEKGYIVLGSYCETSDYLNCQMKILRKMSGFINSKLGRQLNWLILSGSSTFRIRDPVCN